MKCHFYFPVQKKKKKWNYVTFDKPNQNPKQKIKWREFHYKQSNRQSAMMPMANVSNEMQTQKKYFAAKLRIWTWTIHRVVQAQNGIAKTLDRHAQYRRRKAMQSQSKTQIRPTNQNNLNVEKKKWEEKLVSNRLVGLVYMYLCKYIVFDALCTSEKWYVGYLYSIAYVKLNIWIFLSTHLSGVHVPKITNKVNERNWMKTIRVKINWKFQTVHQV